MTALAPLLTPDEAADILKVSTKTLDRLARDALAAWEGK